MQRKVLFLLYLAIVFSSCIVHIDPLPGELGGECSTQRICNDGLICDTSVNICVAIAQDGGQDCFDQICYAKCIDNGFTLGGYCVESSCHCVSDFDAQYDEQLHCIDNDNDNYGYNCENGNDCDDSSNLCNTSCVDVDNDTILDCKDDCIDRDEDGYGTGNDCLGSDCDDLNKYIHPEAREICGNYIDEDCENGDLNCSNCSFTRVDQNLGLTENSSGQAVSFLDFDNDNNLDIYVVNGSSQGEQDFLYKNNINTFERIDSISGISDQFAGTGVASGDYDNDGDLDIFVANSSLIPFQHDILYENNLNIFEQVDQNLGINSSSNRGALFGDYDNDGDLDIFAVSACIDNNKSSLYRNDGNVFANIIDESGIVCSNAESATFGDYDNDGDLDIYITNTNFESDSLYRNNENYFEEIGISIGIDDQSNGEGVAFFDYDNDGNLDIFVVNNYGENDFLYRNNGTSFERVDNYLGINDSSSGMGLAIGDYNNDGYLDVYVSNWLNDGQDFLYRNNKTNFERVDIYEGIVDSSNGRGVAFGDYDNDGDLDIYVANDNEGQDFLYRNNCPQRSFITIRPVIVNPNNTYRDAIGARVYVDLDGRGDFLFPGTLMQEVSGGSGLGSQNQSWLHFGLNDILHDVSIMVIFPGTETISKRTVVYSKVEINRRVILKMDGSIEAF